MVSIQFYIYVFKQNWDGQIATSCGKEGVDHKNGWEHVWLMGNNSTNLSSWKMANLRSLPVSWNFSGLVNKRFLDLSHHLKPKARVHDFGVIECGYSVYIWWLQRNFGQRWSLEKNRLHYGNKAIIYVFNLNFHMWFWGNNMVLRFLKKKLKIVPRGISVFGGKSMEKLDGCISHCWWWAHFSPVREQGQVMSWFVNFNEFPVASHLPPICAEDISQPELGEAAFMKCGVVPVGTQVTYRS